MISDDTIEVNGITYRSGWPDAKGYYDCIIDGEEIKLYHFICELKRNKHDWILPDGSRLVGETIYWKQN